MSALSLRPSRAALALGIPQPFGAAGGTPPYVYAVLSGGAGGTIDASSGAYVAPSQSGQDIVQVTDNAGDTAQSPVLVGSPLQLFCDVLQHELSLADGRIFLWDQKLPSPNDEDLYIAVAMLQPKAFGTTNRMDNSGNSVQSINMQATLSVDVISRGTAALDRKEEVVLAFDSNYSRAQQELNSFRIFPLSSGFVNLSDIDGAAIPYRFNISARLHYVVKKTQAIPYFDDFSDVAITTEP